MLMVVMLGWVGWSCRGGGRRWTGGVDGRMHGQMHMMASTRIERCMCFMDVGMM